MNKKLSVAWLPILGLVFLTPSCEKKSESFDHDVFDVQRRNMVRLDLQEQGIKSERVLNAMMMVPRHLFLPDKYRDAAYTDADISIGPFITTPRPFIVARTIELLDLTGEEKVLEVGTGRGYQSALLGDLAKEVYTIEIVPELAKEAESLLKLLNYKNVHCKTGDGFQGWPDQAPFDAILVMAGAPSVPPPLLDQLAMGGRLVMPIGKADEQSLVLYRKTASELKQESIMPIKLKPLEGQAARHYW